MASPAIHPSRPSGLIDPRQPGDYPIILGESLKEYTKSKDSFINVRYNWQPKSGFLDGRESKMKKIGERWHLDVSNSGSHGYQYVARGPAEQSGISEDGTKSLALIFDESKSAFILEAISATLDMNLKAGSGMSRENARELPQLPRDLQMGTKESQPKGHANTSSDDESADASNPYDFRHFLAEARENAEKATTVPGNRTPLPGSRTPLSGTSTPIPGGNRLPTTPQFRSTPATKPSKPTEQRKKKNEVPPRNTKATSKTTAKREIPKTTQALSKATISDSDSDDQTIDVARAPAPRAAISKPTQPARGKGHNRNISANIGSSPHIIINDDDGGLEIDMGSPPPEESRSRRGRVDPEMFRSHTGTPIGGLSSNLGSRPVSRPPIEEPARGGAFVRERDRDNDVKMRDIEAASEDDEDEDVEEFELGSPREKSKVPRRGDVSRDVESDDEGRGRGRRPQQQQVEEAAPTPPQPTTYEEDDEDLLEAALEAALEEEDDSQHGGIGLGIGMANNNTQDDDESEVSEEE